MANLFSASKLQSILFVSLGMTALGTFVFIYAILWNFVGRFPAESLEVGDSKSNAALALCYQPNNKGAEFTTVPSRYAPDIPHGPLLKFDPGTNPDLTDISSSRALVFAADQRAIYSINPLDSNDVARLYNLAFWGPLNNALVQQFTASANALYPPCPDPATDRGITEAYWATKGTVVIHHWAYLYEASVFDGKSIHAQYGFLVSLAAKAITIAMHLPGPTYFVRVAWWVFCFVGILASIGLFFIFRRTPQVGFLAVTAQILAFTTLGAFSILLAPGYHWSRELAMIEPLILLSVFEHQRRRFALLLPTIAGGLILSYALDPNFTVFAFACLSFALVIRNRSTINIWISARPRSALAALTLLFITGLAFTYEDRSNVGYLALAFSTFGRDALADQQRNLIFALDVTLAAALIVLAWFHRVTVTATYFALISIVVLLYYAITPDSFHYGKYIAYCIPLYATVAAMLYGQIKRVASTSLILVINYAIALAAFCMCGLAVIKLTSLPVEWQLRTYDAGNRAYFSSRAVMINNRLIEADINKDTVERLMSFPAALPYDFLLSPLDKYVLFFYDRHNGFPYVDYLSAMSNDPQLASVEARLSAPNTRIILDSSILRVNPLSGLVSNHATFGYANDQSAINIKEQVRYNELAGYLLHRCLNHGVDSKSHWIFIQC